MGRAQRRSAPSSSGGQLNYTNVLCAALLTATILFGVDYLVYGKFSSSIDSPSQAKLPTRTRLVIHNTSRSLPARPERPTNITPPPSASPSKAPILTTLTRAEQHPPPPPPLQQRSVSYAVYGANLSSCPSSVSESYALPDEVDGAHKGLSWCKQMKSNYGVILGRSWGGLPREAQKEWDRSKCNEQLKLGKLQSCEERWGWSYLNNWLKSARTLVRGQSTVTCGSEIKTSTFCRYANVVVDFSKATVSLSSRAFARGFVHTYGELDQSAGDFPDVPGILHEHVGRSEAHKDMRCDEIEKRPVFVISNDDIFNLGHYMNDVMTVWNMVTLSKRDSKTAVLINFDGIRAGGPAGGGAHRLMLASRPDEHGPFGGYFESWFGEVRKATDYAKKRVCFAELYFQPFPGVPWFWNDWSAINDCSVKSASPLFQSFNLFFRKRWAAAHPSSPPALPSPDDGDVVHVVVEMRGLKREKGMASICRYIANMPELVRVLKTIPNVRITAKNFAEISFAEQVALTHSAGVYVSMHGAGTTHLFHAAIGKPNCCALVELQPDHSMKFQFSLGHGNQARMLGSHYFRYEAADGLTRSDGTHVDVAIVKNLVAQAVLAVRTKPTCLHAVRDTTIDVLEAAALGA